MPAKPHILCCDCDLCLNGPVRLRVPGVGAVLRDPAPELALKLSARRSAQERDEYNAARRAYRARQQEEA